MSLTLAIPMALHQFATLVWIGGLFFAHFALRPTIKQSLEPPARIQVALGVFSRFFPWVWLSIALLWVSGIWIAIGHGGEHLPLHVTAMAALALVMTAVFVYLFVVPYRKMRIAVEYENWRWASAKFADIRKLMGLNLLLGLLTVAVAAVGPAVSPTAQAMLDGFFAGAPDEADLGWPAPPAR